MKKFKVMPAEVFGLEFADGKVIEMTFNMKALAYLGELINNKKDVFNSHLFYSSIIYAGCKAINENFTEEEANALYIQLSESHPEAMNGILEEYCIASGVNQEDIKKNVIMNLMS